VSDLVAPDFAEPVLGFRAWELGSDGRLGAVAVDGHWQNGVNTAQCAYRRHRAPARGCTCGLYALNDMNDRRLWIGGYAVGAIAAWGDIEMYRTGFRAQKACVVAMARESARLSLLERTSGFYDVPLVARGELRDFGLRWAVPAVFEPVDVARPFGHRPIPTIDGILSGPARGVSIDDHVWLEAGYREVRLGITSAFAHRLGSLDAQPALPPVGREVEAGDVLTVLGDGIETYYVRSPVSGCVTEINSEVARDAATMMAEPERKGWLVRIRPTRWVEDAPNVAWGGSGTIAYQATLMQRGLIDPFRTVLGRRIRALPVVRSWAEVKEVVRRESEAPRFDSADDLHTRLGGALTATLQREAWIRRALSRLRRNVAFVSERPDAALVLEMSGQRVKLLAASPTDASDCELCLRASGDRLHDLFCGHLDLARALRTGELSSSQAAGPTLAALSVLRHLRIEPLVRLASWDRASVFKQ
jgi:glycine cleavage system H lipoate-binding protein